MSPDVCVHRPPCPGCPRFGVTSLPESAIQDLELLARASDISLEQVTGPAFGYRRRARLSVRAMPSGIDLGIFEEGSHRLVGIPDCRLHHPAIAALLPVLRQSIERAKLPAYVDATHGGLLRTIQFAVERGTEQVQLVFVLKTRPERLCEFADILLNLVSDLERRLSPRGMPKLNGVFLNAQGERNNSLMGSEFFHLSGAPYIVDRSGSARVFYPPGAFGQANPDLHDQAVARIFAFASGQERVAEYYAGVGSIGLGLAASTPHLLLNEVGAGSLEGLALGLAEISGVRPRVLPGRAESYLEELKHQDLLIVDPPRKGLGEEMVQGILRAKPRRIAYLSCGLPSFLREARSFLDAGYRLQSLCALGYFPFTLHLESLGLFELKA